MKTASERYDMEQIDDQLLRGDQYCEKHDLFAVQNILADYICPACAAEEAIERL